MVEKEPKVGVRALAVPLIQCNLQKSLTLFRSPFLILKWKSNPPFLHGELKKVQSVSTASPPLRACCTEGCSSQPA